MKPWFKQILPKPLVNEVYKLIYQGNAVWCPCCEKSFSKFMPYRTRKNAACPNCRSLERHRLLWLYIKNKTNLLTDQLKVLHIAPESSFLPILQSQPNLDYLSADLVSPLAMEKIDITQIPYPDCTFDVILCNHVLEHIPDDRKAIQELYRVLKPQGWGIIQSPIDPTLEKTYEDFTITTDQGRKQAFGQEDHLRIYGEDYSTRLKQGGFIVAVDNYGEQLDSSQKYRYGIMTDEQIYLCHK